MNVTIAILSLLVCFCTAAEKKKRDYFPVDTDYPTSFRGQYLDDAYAHTTGRTLKRKESNASILKHLDRRRPDGSYNYEFLTDNGIHTQESSVQNGYDRVVRGSYSYIGPDGKTYTVNYIADRNGYRAYGAHLPTQPDAVANIIQQAQTGVISTTGNYVPLYTSTIAPIYNRPGTRHRPNYHVSSTPAPFVVTAGPTTQQPYLSTVNYNNELPVISSTPFPQSYDGYSATPAPISVYTATTPTTLINNYEYPSSTPSPFVRPTPQPGYNSRNTVYITPAPKTYITNGYVAQQPNYLRNDLLPPQQQFANEFNHNVYFGGNQELDPYYPQQQQYDHNLQQAFELPTVQPLDNKFRNSFSSIRPSAFDRINRRY